MMDFFSRSWMRFPPNEIPLRLSWAGAAPSQGAFPRPPPPEYLGNCRPTLDPPVRPSGPHWQDCRKLELK